MDSLPNELILVLLSYLEPVEIVNLSATSSHYLKLCRDSAVWKPKCFHDSRGEMIRRRKERLESQDPLFAALTRAMTQSDDSLQWMSAHTKAQDFSNAQVTARAMANWDPAYPDEKIDFYQEYIHMSARISVKWMQSVKDGTGEATQEREALGMGFLNHPYAGAIQNVISPLDDGSVCIWDIATSNGRGKLHARSMPNVLFPRSGNSIKSSISNEPGAVDNVSVDSTQKKAYIASLNQLNEVDLNTLQVVTSTPFPFPITALSKVEHPVPITVGTLNTLHLHDVRIKPYQRDSTSTTRLELIGGTGGFRSLGSISSSVVSLSQPGPLSILHLPTSSLDVHSNDIWIAGRFTSLLNYDRRFWPRIKTTLFSGGRLSSLSYLPHPFISRDLNVLKNPNVSISELQRAKSQPGMTLVAAGEYKGKGSLELYGISQASRNGSATTPSAQTYLNRQTASRTRLLSVAPHGAQLVCSDGDGNVKWVERDGFTVLRTFNLDDHPPPGLYSRSGSRSGSVSSAASSNVSTTSSVSPGVQRIDHFSQTLEEGHDDMSPPNDIVQKIIPIGASNDRHNRDDLLIWTGDGRVGLIGFGTGDAGNEWFEEEAEKEVETELSRKERAYGKTMRRALEKHADEARFVRGLGLGTRPPGT